MLNEYPFSNNNLPVEMSFLIFNHLTVKDLGSCCRVSKSWRKFASSDVLWENKEKDVYQLAVKKFKNDNNPSIKSKLDCYMMSNYLKTIQECNDLVWRLEFFMTRNELGYIEIRFPFAKREAKIVTIYGKIAKDNFVNCKLPESFTKITKLVCVDPLIDEKFIDYSIAAFVNTQFGNHVSWSQSSSSGFSSKCFLDRGGDPNANPWYYFISYQHTILPANFSPKKRSQRELNDLGNKYVKDAQHFHQKQPFDGASYTPQITVSLNDSNFKIRYKTAEIED